MPERVLLLSIHQIYADRIFNGEKTVELRKIRPNVTSGDRIIVYVPSPTKAICGCFEVQDVIEEEPSVAWKRYGRETGISKDRFEEYFYKSSTAFVIRISKAHRFHSLIGLSQIRNKLPDFCPPQCYRYLSDQDIDKIGFTYKRIPRMTLAGT